LVGLLAVVLFLGFSIISDMGTETGPDLMIVAAFVAGVLVCVSLGSWVALRSETPKFSF
jgi:hypothetical protein